MGPAPSDPGPADSLVLHATAIAHGGGALLITGDSGSGKSALALQCIGLGAELVADDRTSLKREGGMLLATSPQSIAGLIEVRGLGILRLPHVDHIPVRGVVSLSDPETERLPPRRTTELLGTTLPLYRRVEGAHFAKALLLCLTGARLSPDPPTGPSP